MHSRGRRLKFTAVAVLVVLSLTGFSSGRGHGSRSSGGSGGSGDSGDSGDSGGSGGSGGGCSSSSQNHDSSSSTTSGGGTYRAHEDDDDYAGSSSGSTSGSSSRALEDAKVKLVSCATEADAYATVAVTNPNSRGSYFTVTVRFLDADSVQVDVTRVDEFVAGNETTEVRVPLDNPGPAAKVDHCDPDLYAPTD